MLTIRFKRIGRKKMPIYRIVVMEKHKDPWANYKEKLGFYNPRTKETELKEDRIKYWLSVGAQASNTVHNLLVKNGLIEGDKKKSVKISKKRNDKINDKKAVAEEKAKEVKETKEEPSEPVTEEKTEEASVVEEKVETEEVKTEEVSKDEPKEEKYNPKQLLRQISKTKLDTSKLKPNDHRILGQKLDLFSFSETAPGMVFWHNNGWVIYNELVKFWREEHMKDDYEEISRKLIEDKIDIIKSNN